jgi:acetyl-CoA acetyltransferase
MLQIEITPARINCAGDAAARNAKRDAKKGLATLCIGGGMGIAMCIARD